MMTIKRFKEIINSVEPNWTITFHKYEHMSPTPNGPYQGYKGFQNIVGVRICNISDRYNDLDGTKIRTVILVDDMYGFEGHPQDYVDTLLYDLTDNDHIDFVLEVEETPGHFDHITLQVSAGDKGYSDKCMYIDLDEEKLL